LKGFQYVIPIAETFGERLEITGRGGTSVQEHHRRTAFGAVSSHKNRRGIFHGEVLLLFLPPWQLVKKKRRKEKRALFRWFIVGTGSELCYYEV
jgi:hypothetical protein